MIVNAKESYDKGSKGEAVCLGVMTVLLYAVTAYNLISRAVNLNMMYFNAMDCRDGFWVIMVFALFITKCMYALKTG